MWNKRNIVSSIAPCSFDNAFNSFASHIVESAALQYISAIWRNKQTIPDNLTWFGILALVRTYPPPIFAGIPYIKTFSLRSRSPQLIACDNK